jgi:patatin-like phospholipase/acyl hydrolase
MAKYRIVSMDGGGVRGVLTARLLEKIVGQYPDFLKNTHLFAGTSTGSILAVGLAKGITPTELVGIYQKESPHIFHKDIWHEVGELWGLNGAKYETSNRFDSISAYFGDTKLSELQQNVLVATFQLDSLNPISPSDGPQRWKGKFFHNFPGHDSDGEQKATDVIMRSSAAPVYFPLYQGFVDGGVIANNPSLCALTQSLDPRTGTDHSIHDIHLMSFGTGTRPQFITARDSNWGLRQWGFNLIDMLMESGSSLPDYQCQQLIGECYRRVNPPLPRNIGLDAVNEIDAMIAMADQFASGPEWDNLLQWVGDRFLSDTA